MDQDCIVQDVPSENAASADSAAVAQVVNVAAGMIEERMERLRKSVGKLDRLWFNDPKREKKKRELALAIGEMALYKICLLGENENAIVAAANSILTRNGRPNERTVNVRQSVQDPDRLRRKLLARDAVNVSAAEPAGEAAP